MELTIKFPLNQQEIKSESKKIRDMIQERQDEIKILRNALTTVEKMCKHEHPAQGYNERDGSWASPCIHCGYAY